MSPLLADSADSATTPPSVDFPEGHQQTTGPREGGDRFNGDPSSGQHQVRREGGSPGREAPRTQRCTALTHAYRCSQRHRRNRRREQRCGCHQLQRRGPRDRQSGEQADHPPQQGRATQEPSGCTYSRDAVEVVMNADPRTRWGVPPAPAPTSLKLKPAARRQYLLQVLRGRVPREPAPPKTP